MCALYGLFSFGRGGRVFCGILIAMSFDQGNEWINKPGSASEGLRSVEEFWQVSLPDKFCSIYSYFSQPFLAPCEFFTLDAISKGYGRSYGMLPQFMPFGRAVGEGGAYGFYISPDTVQGFWPVLYWDEDEMYLRPAASNFDSFLRYCILIARYETEEQLDTKGSEDVPDSDVMSEQREAGRRLELDSDIIFGALPRNDTELYERLAHSDPQDASSLCHLGCVSRSRGDTERALDFYHRAIEAAPWFGDSSYLLADTYRETRNNSRAVQGWWAVVQRLLPLCTRTWEWNLGDKHPEGDIYEVAADALAQYSEHVESETRSTALWRVVVNDDPYDPDVRESFGDALLAAGDLNGAEREYLNGLSLSCSERGRQPDRLYGALCKLYQRQGRAREARLASFDSPAAQIERVDLL